MPERIQFSTTEGQRQRYLFRVQHHASDSCSSDRLFVLVGLWLSLLATRLHSQHRRHLHRWLNSSINQIKVPLYQFTAYLDRFRHRRWPSYVSVKHSWHYRVLSSTMTCRRDRLPCGVLRERTLLPSSFQSIRWITNHHCLVLTVLVLFAFVSSRRMFATSTSVGCRRGFLVGGFLQRMFAVHLSFDCIIIDGRRFRRLFEKLKYSFRVFENNGHGRDRFTSSASSWRSSASDRRTDRPLLFG